MLCMLSGIDIGKQVVFGELRGVFLVRVLFRLGWAILEVSCFLHLGPGLQRRRLKMWTFFWFCLAFEFCFLLTLSFSPLTASNTL